MPPFANFFKSIGRQQQSPAVLCHMVVFIVGGASRNGTADESYANGGWGSDGGFSLCFSTAGQVFLEFDFGGP